MSKPILGFICIYCLVLLTCGGHKSEGRSDPGPSAPTKPAASPLVGFEKDLAYVKNGQFSYIYVFSRKDGKPLQPEDSQFLRKEAPQMVDCVTSEEGKKAICGTNFNLEEGNMGTLKKRFVVEDYTGR
jgi:hypothetical protein